MLPSTPIIQGKVEKEARARRRMLSVSTVGRKVTTNQIVGLQDEEKKGKA